MSFEYEITTVFESRYGGTDVEPLSKYEIQEISDEINDLSSNGESFDLHLLVINTVENRD